jgi:hypothetical protein
MNIPNFLTDKIVDENGELTTPWSRTISQLFIELEHNLSNEGYVLPQQPTDNINQLTEPQSVGAMIYDSTTNEFKVNIAGTWKVVQVV